MTDLKGTNLTYVGGRKAALMAGIAAQKLGLKPVLREPSSKYSAWRLSIRVSDREIIKLVDKLGAVSR